MEHWNFARTANFVDVLKIKQFIKEFFMKRLKKEKKEVRKEYFRIYLVTSHNFIFEFERN